MAVTFPPNAAVPGFSTRIVEMLTFASVASAMAADPMVALEMAAAAMDAAGMATLPVNAGPALGALRAFNDASPAMRAAVSWLATWVKSTAAPSKSELVSFSNTISSIRVL